MSSRFNRSGKRNCGKPQKWKKKKSSNGFSKRRVMTWVECRNHNIHRDREISCQVKTENVLNKCRWFQSIIKEQDDEKEKVIRGRPLEKLPFLDQMKFVDLNISLDELNYKLSYCTKYFELSFKYVKLMSSFSLEL